jgi:tetratricopeptide (TPR) repeat protein
VLSAHFSSSSWLRAGWIVAIVALASVRIWNALRGPLLRGYDDLGHAGYFLYLHFYAALPWADQGWSYFHPPLHYFFGWALTGFGSPEVLLRGVALLGGAASLGIAALAARVVERTRPGLRGLPLLAFTSVGLLPVYLYTGTMAGNELSATFLGTLALALFVTNECRDDPTPRLDALVGLALGLALLTKFSGALFAAAVGLGLLARGLRAGGEFAVWRRLALRGAIVAGIALLVCAPYYARNVREFGTPFRLSRDTPHVAELESRQLPGSRTWRDFVRISPKLFVNPRLEAPHLVRSVWGSAYAQTWADARNEWDILHPGHPRVRLTRSLGVCLGLLPSLLALVGAGLALGDVRRRRRVEVYTPLLAIAALTLVSFALFAWQVPQFSATKASYLLGLTLPYAAFLCRALEGLACAAPRAVFRIALALVVLPAAASAAIHTHALVLPAMRSHEALGALRTALGDVQGARVEFYQQSRRPVMTGREVEWSDNFAALWLLEGDAARAADTYARHRPRPGEDPFRWNAIGVANALAGRTGRALRNFDRAIAAGAGEVALVNRGAVRATLGQLEDAERDLREALALDSRLAPAWHALAEVLSGDGRASEAGSARERAAAAAARGPRGYPYGIPDGLGQWPSFELGYRFLLWLEGRSLRLAHAPFRAQDASAFAAPPPAKPNLVLVVIDTLRADHVGAYGYGRPTTPRIDALARRGVRFARASAPSSWTLPSVASIFTSLPPPEHGAVAWGEKLLAGLPTLAEALRAGATRRSASRPTSCTSPRSPASTAASTRGRH